MRGGAPAVGSRPTEMQQGVRLPWMKQELIEPVRGLGAPGSCRPPTTPSVPVSPIRAKFKHRAALIACLARQAREDVESKPLLERRRRGCRLGAVAVRPPRRERRPDGSSSGRRSVGRVGECLRNGPCGDELCAHARHIAHLALLAPLKELGDGFVVLRRAQDAYRIEPGSMARSCRSFRLSHSYFPAKPVQPPGAEGKPRNTGASPQALQPNVQASLRLHIPKVANGVGPLLRRLRVWRGYLLRGHAGIRSD
jgi:hypothetical protein